MAFDMAKFLARFVEEAREHVEKLNKGLVFLEKNPDDSETINAIFRSAHTIKGSSRMMKLTHITGVAHKTEDVL
ncbi:MAG TPA: hybrid sensor histidine kinase/response regulator, partial [Nitrospiraceae bacterium]|nr:hybrid sensor histidine kinase/response regulator [Nitrospiraceae bacterium]